MNTQRELTGRQRHVLLVLADGAKARSDWGAWYPLRTQQIYGIISALERRGLVDVAGFDGNARTFKLTEAGRTAVDKIAPPDEEDAQCPTCNGTGSVFGPLAGLHREYRTVCADCGGTGFVCSNSREENS